MNIAGHEDREPPSGGSDRSSGEGTDSRDREPPSGGSDRSSGEGTDSRDREPPSGGSDRSSGEGTDSRDREPPSGGSDRSSGDLPSDSADQSGEGDDGDGTVLEFSDAGEETDAGGSADEEDDDVEPVELLVQLAEEGEIDPWDIDIVHVTDRFLEALDDRDLRTSGRALFYASVLLRMKSDELFAADEPEEEELPPWEAPFADDAGGPMDGGDGEGGHPPGFDPVESLEAEMERRLERKHARGKPETLDELVRELRSAERDSWWKESRSYDTSDSPSGYDRGVQELNYHADDDFRVDDEPTSDDVTHTTHEEDIESVIDDVEVALEEHYENGRDEVLYAEIDDTGGSRVMTYLALLFLAHRGRIELEQDELFGDLWIQRPTLEADPEEAVAD
nr:ScpA family protein [Halopiger goleimassiliensis]